MCRQCNVLLLLKTSSSRVETWLSLFFFFVNQKQGQSLCVFFHVVESFCGKETWLLLTVEIRLLSLLVPFKFSRFRTLDKLLGTTRAACALHSRMCMSIVYHDTRNNTPCPLSSHTSSPPFPPSSSLPHLRVRFAAPIYAHSVTAVIG